MISVIVIGKNEGPRLSDCFIHIKQALYALSHELIYVDSHSTDDSLTIALNHGARCFQLEESDTTAGLGRYVGTQAARGEFLLFLDGDMELQTGFAEHALMAIASGPYDGVCGIREDHYLKDGQIDSVCKNYFGCVQKREAPEFGGAILLRADALARCGGWATDTIACEESELHARLLAAGCHILEVPVPMIVHNDAVRDTRSLWHVLFSRRRLGEGQAFRCALKSNQAAAYMRHERKKFLFYALDWLALLLLITLGLRGLALFCFLQALQIGYEIARRQPRAYVSAKLFFFAFPAGLLSYRPRQRGYTEIH